MVSSQEDVQQKVELSLYVALDWVCRAMYSIFIAAYEDTAVIYSLELK